MIELNDFYNAGFGWICRHCEHELKLSDSPADVLPRIFREGEAESKTPEFSNLALAKWMDKTQRVLVCPRCGITEPVERS